MFVKVFILLFGWEISSLTVAVCVYMEFQGDHRVQLNFYWKVSSCPCDSKASARLPLKCEHVNLKAGAVEKVNRKSDREWKRENWGGLLFLSSVFFHSSITQCGEGSFPPTHHRCQRGHTQTVRVNVHSTLYTLIQAHTHMDDSKGHSTYLHPLSITYHSLLSWLCLFSLRKILFFSHHSFLKSLICFCFTWIGFLSLGSKQIQLSSNYLLPILYFFQCEYDD